MSDALLEAVLDALDLITKYGAHDGAHHKAWVLDQVVRILCGNTQAYTEWVREYEAGADGPNTYVWDPGIAP
jgi:hypothetical protein